MGGVISLIGRRLKLQIGRGRGGVRLDISAQAGGIGGRDKLGHGIIDEGRIAQLRVSIDEGAPLGLRNIVGRLDRGITPGIQRIGGQDLKNFADGRPPGTGRRRRDQSIAMIGAHHRPVPDHCIVSEILESEYAPVGLAGSHHGPGDRASIKGVGPFFGYGFKRRRELALHQPLARFVGRSLIEEDGRHVGLGGEPGGSGAQNPHVSRGQDIAVSGQGDGRRHDLGQRKGPVFLEGFIEPHDRAGHAHG